MKRDIENFRALLFLSAVTLAVAIWFGFIQFPLTEAQTNFINGGGVGALVDPQMADFLWFSWLVLYSLAHVFGFLLSWMARYIFILTFGLTVITSIIGGLSVGSPWDNTAWALHTAIATFAIGMLFFSPGVVARTRRDWHATVKR